MGARSIPPPPPVIRRALHVLWPAVGVLLTVALVPLVVVSALHTFLDRRARLFRVSCLGVLLVWLDVSVLVRCWALGARRRDAADAERREEYERLLSDALDSVMYATRRWLGLEVRLTERMHFGSEEEPLVALSRHAGPFDSLAVAWLLARTAGRLPRLVLAEAIRWDPAFDTVLTRLDSFFVPSAAGADRLEGVARMASTLDRDDVFVLFPEGQNWSPSRRSRIIRRLRARGHHERADRAEQLVNVLPPKTRGAWAAREARPAADVMVIAHAGFGELSTARQVWDAVPFHDRPLLVRTWTYRAAEVPTDEAAFAEWLDARWGEVDAWVTAHTPDGGAGARAGRNGPGPTDVGAA